MPDNKVLRFRDKIQPEAGGYTAAEAAAAARHDLLAASVAMRAAARLLGALEMYSVADNLKRLSESCSKTAEKMTDLGAAVAEALKHESDRREVAPDRPEVGGAQDPPATVEAEDGQGGP